MLLCLFSEEQMMKKGSKADLGTYLKNFGSSSVTSVNDNIPLIIDGGWLHHQISSFIGCPTYGDVDNEYLGLLLPKYAQGKVTVVFDGYARSIKNHEHELRSNSYCSEVHIKSSTICSLP